MADLTGAAGTKTINQSRRVRSLGGGKSKAKKKTQRKPKEKVRSTSLRNRS